MKTDLKMTTYFQELFDRDLGRLELEINDFNPESNLWVIPSGVLNSAGNLAVHLCGNLRHFIGHELGGFDYQRDREREFSVKNLPKNMILEEILLCKNQVKSSLDRLEDQILHEKYPIEHFGKPMTYGFFLAHLYGHLNYHLGQINYLRRIIEA
ncbi:DinB family protein [Algoriphagus sp.]|uniref:DinB family protein n=1 Tax=Algoriphagus sp. TaxID=1872435 RepID=UPI00260C921E|nr:DinB family protein [Algoriphagus sp.]